MRTTTSLLLFGFATILVFAGVTRAEDTYYSVAVASLKSTNNTPASKNEIEASLPRPVPFRWHAVVGGQGEAYVDDPKFSPWMDRFSPDARICVQAPAGSAVTGRLYAFKSGVGTVDVFEFKFAPTDAKRNAKDLFFRAKESYYERLQEANIPGAAWFRHQAQEAARARGKTNSAIALNRTPFPPRPTDVEDSYALYSGGRALSENLQLDRLLPPTGTNAVTVDITNLTGITVKPMNWKDLIKDARPELDPLAASIPADQHAIFFPSFTAMTQMIDEADANGTPVLQLMEPRSQDGGSRAFYQKQLCLGMNEISRMLGPKVIASVAFTGSDPFVRVGTDIAVLFEAQNPDVLKAFLVARQKAAQTSDATVESVKGNIEDVAYVGVLSPDRSVSSYIASISNLVIVCNSSNQLENIVSVAKGNASSLASQDEYIFFRSRYARGEAGETAFVVLSDAAIRRWCGPRWRIADSRRTRAAAALAELQARHVSEIISGTAKSGVLNSEFKLPDAGEWQLTPSGVSSSVYGSLRFMTPIAEIPLTKVTRAEADSYQRWRDSYQNYWRQFYDPIAIRFSVAPGQLGARLTIMPLIASSEYNNILRFSSGAAIGARDGDPHANTLLHLVFAVNPDSPEIADAGNFLGTMAPGLKANPFGWLGHSISVYLDDDPFWDRLKHATNTDDFLEKNYLDLPVALRVEVSKPLGLAAFLTSLHAFVDQSAPQLTTWQNLDYNGQPYVKITSKAAEGDTERQPVVYYAATPGSLVVTLNEALLKRALDRQAGAQTSGLASVPLSPWLGTNIAVSAERGFVDVAQALARDTYEAHLQELSWNNLPILNEWKRLYPDRDPVEVHEQLWGTKLICPGGGTYVWDEKWQTMESTVFGHPGAPKKGAGMALSEMLSLRLGVNFEHDGLSASAILNRKAKE